MNESQEPNTTTTIPNSISSSLSQQQQPPHQSSSSSFNLELHELPITITSPNALVEEVLGKKNEKFCCICCSCHDSEYFREGHLVTEENFDLFSCVYFDYDQLLEFISNHFHTNGGGDAECYVCDYSYHSALSMFTFKERYLSSSLDDADNIDNDPTQDHNHLLVTQEELMDHQSNNNTTTTTTTEITTETVNTPTAPVHEMQPVPLMNIDQTVEDIYNRVQDHEQTGTKTQVDDVESRILQVIEQTAKGIEDQMSQGFYKPTVLDIVKDMIRVVAALAITLSMMLVGAVPIMFIERPHEKKTTGGVTKWTYRNSVYYVITTLTTIGLGDITPATDGGKVYMIFFTLFTMGLVGLSLAFAGQSMLRTAGSLMFLLILYIKRFLMVLLNLCCIQPALNENERGVDGEGAISLLDSSIFFSEHLTLFERRLYRFIHQGLTQIVLQVLFLICYALVSAAIYYAIEGWSYFHSIWFCFVTLTTIGYGDYYPTRPATKLYYCFYVVFGTANVALLLGFVGQAVADRIKKSLETIQQKAIERARVSERKLANAKLQLIMQDVKSREKNIRSHVDGFKQKQRHNAQRKANAFIKHRSNIQNATKETTMSLGKGIHSQIKNGSDALRKNVPKPVLLNVSLFDRRGDDKNNSSNNISDEKPSE